MKAIKKEDHVLFKNEHGEYHMMLSKYNELGDKAQEYAEKEIEKKTKSVFTGETINFKQARALGFCEYGIEDFCSKLNLGTDGEYKITDLNKRLTLEVLTEYPDECVKLFGKDTLKYLGGVKEVLNENTISLVLRPEFIDEVTLHKLSAKFARQSLANYEKQCPNDNRGRKAIEAKEAWIRGDITDEQLSAARSAARSAESAAWSARSAESAAWSARSASWSARSAAWSAANKEQVEMILKEIEG